MLNNILPKPTVPELVSSGGQAVTLPAQKVLWGEASQKRAPLLPPLSHSEAAKTLMGAGAYPNVNLLTFPRDGFVSRDATVNTVHTTERALKLQVGVQVRATMGSRVSDFSNRSGYLKFTAPKDALPLVNYANGLLDVNRQPLQVTNVAAATAALAAANTRKTQFANPMGEPHYDHRLLLAVVSYASGALVAGSALQLAVPAAVHVSVADETLFPLRNTDFLLLDHWFNDADELATLACMLNACGITEIITLNGTAPAIGRVLAGDDLLAYVTKLSVRIIATASVHGNGAIYECVRFYAYMRAISYHGQTDEASMFRDLIRHGLRLPRVIGFAQPLDIRDYKGVSFTTRLTRSQCQAYVLSGLVNGGLIYSLSDPALAGTSMPSMFVATAEPGRAPRAHNPLSSYPGLKATMSAGVVLFEKNMARAHGDLDPTVTMERDVLTSFDRGDLMTAHFTHVMLPFASAYFSGPFRAGLGDLEVRTEDLDGPVTGSRLPMFPPGTLFSAGKNEGSGANELGLKNTVYYAVISGSTTFRRFGLPYFRTELNPRDGLALVREVVHPGLGTGEPALRNLEPGPANGSLATRKWYRVDNPTPADGEGRVEGPKAVLCIGSDGYARLPTLAEAPKSHVSLTYGVPKPCRWDHGAGGRAVEYKSVPADKYFGRGLLGRAITDLPEVFGSSQLLVSDKNAFGQFGAQRVGVAPVRGVAEARRVAGLVGKFAALMDEQQEPDREVGSPDDGRNTQTQSRFTGGGASGRKDEESSAKVEVVGLKYVTNKGGQRGIEVAKAVEGGEDEEGTLNLDPLEPASTRLANAPPPSEGAKGQEIQSKAPIKTRAGEAFAGLRALEATNEKGSYRLAPTDAERWNKPLSAEELGVYSYLDNWVCPDAFHNPLEAQLGLLELIATFPELKALVEELAYRPGPSDPHPAYSLAELGEQTFLTGRSKSGEETVATFGGVKISPSFAAYLRDDRDEGTRRRALTPAVLLAVGLFTRLSGEGPKDVHLTVIKEMIEGAGRDPEDVVRTLLAQYQHVYGGQE